MINNNKKQNSYIKHYTNKLLLILATFFILFSVANAGTLSDSSGVLTYDSVNVCMADGSTQFTGNVNFGGNEINNVSNIITDSLYIDNSAIPCPSGYFMTEFYGNSSTCVQGILPDGSVNFSGDLNSNYSANFQDMSLGNSINDLLLLFDTERSWQFEGSGSGASTTLDLVDNTGGKQFNIRGTNESSSAFTITTSTTGDDLVEIGNDLFVSDSITAGIENENNDHTFFTGSTGVFKIGRSLSEYLDIILGSIKIDMKTSGKPLEFGTSDANDLRLNANNIDKLTIYASENKINIATKSTSPTTCVLGDIYVDTSGAYCGCSITNTWEQLNAVGTCS